MAQYNNGKSVFQNLKKDEGKTHKKKISFTSDSVEKFSEPKPKTNFMNKAIGFFGRITGAAKTSSKLARHSSATSVNVESESTTAGDEDEEFYSADEDDVEGSKQAAKGTSSTSMTRNSACRGSSRHRRSTSKKNNEPQESQLVRISFCFNRIFLCANI